jgi:hypothetical protein
VQSTTHVYEVRSRKDKRGVDLISNALPFGRLWYGEPNAVANAIGYAQHYSRSQNAVIRVYDAGRQRDPDARARGQFQRAVAPSVSLNRQAISIIVGSPYAFTATFTSFLNAETNRKF